MATHYKVCFAVREPEIYYAEHLFTVDDQPAEALTKMFADLSAKNIVVHGVYRLPTDEAGAADQLKREYLHHRVRSFTAAFLAGELTLPTRWKHVGAPVAVRVWVPDRSEPLVDLDSANKQEYFSFTLPGYLAWKAAQEELDLDVCDKAVGLTMRIVPADEPLPLELPDFMTYLLTVPRRNGSELVDLFAEKYKALTGITIVTGQINPFALVMQQAK